MITFHHYSLLPDQQSSLLLAYWIRTNIPSLINTITKLQMAKSRELFILL
jgi:hypothetical protein